MAWTIKGWPLGSVRPGIAGVPDRMMAFQVGGPRPAAADPDPFGDSRYGRESLPIDVRDIACFRVPGDRRWRRLDWSGGAAGPGSDDPGASYLDPIRVDRTNEFGRIFRAFADNRLTAPDFEKWLVERYGAGGGEPQGDETPEPEGTDDVGAVEPFRVPGLVTRAGGGGTDDEGAMDQPRFPDAVVFLAKPPPGGGEPGPASA